MVRHPGDYPWSGNHGNARGKHAVAITLYDCWLLLVSDDDARQATCRDLPREALDEQDIVHIRESIRNGLPTGNDGFRHEIGQALNIRLGLRKRGRPKISNDWLYPTH